MVDRPGFFESFLASYKLGIKHRFAVGLIPYKFLLICVAPIAIIYSNYELDGFNINQDSIVVVISSIMVVGGFIGAASLAALVRIQEIISRFPFSDFLRTVGVFYIAMFIPKFVFMISLISMIYCAVSILFVFINENDFYDKIALVICICVVIYNSVKAYEIIGLIEIITDHYEEYTRMSFEEGLNVD